MSVSEHLKRSARPRRVSPRVRRYVGACLAFSVVVNLLMLVSPLYMLQVYDRIMTSGSMDALVWLSLMAVGALAVYAAAEAGRRRVLSLAGQDFSNHWSQLFFQRFLDDGASQPRLSHDLSLVSRIQSAIQGGLPTALCDLPFAPLFLVLLAVLHPMLGIAGIAGVALILIVAVISELHSRQHGQDSLAEDSDARNFAQGLERQRSAISTMGIGQSAKDKWSLLNQKALASATQTASIDGVYSGLSRTIRQILQVMALGLGAYLAIHQEISAGGIVAGSILMGRALGPIDHIVGGWRHMVKARAAWEELMPHLTKDTSNKTLLLKLPKPDAELEIQRLAVRIPGMDDDLIRPFSMKVESGQIVVILGNNGAGKTTLLQTLAGAWSPHSGLVRLGGRDMHDWAAEDRGAHVGYMPQNIELLPGTVRENIGRMNDADDQVIIEASQFSGAHETVVRLPNGYDTPIGPGGQHLSAGQMQMIGLARAVFNSPTAIFLDEPSANLDSKGVTRLISAMKSSAEIGSVVVLATHDPRLLNIAHTILIIRDGGVLSVPAGDYLKTRHSNDLIEVRTVS